MQRLVEIKILKIISGREIWSNFWIVFQRWKKHWEQSAAEATYLCSVILISFHFFYSNYIPQNILNFAILAIQGQFFKNNPHLSPYSCWIFISRNKCTNYCVFASGVVKGGHGGTMCPHFYILSQVPPYVLFSRGMLGTRRTQTFQTY